MASIFKNKVIKERLINFEVPDFENKLAIIKKWHQAYSDGSLKKKTESQCEQAFNQQIFVDILGYNTFPDDEYTIEAKGSNESSAQKADALLGYFSKVEPKVFAVVEIKDVNTNLDKSQAREGSLTPVQQAFKYKPLYKECRFVISTNFYEFRLHTDNQLDYETFTLDQLVDSKDDYYYFRKFYFLLNVSNFIAKQGKSKTELLLSEILQDQETITKAFYDEYQKLRKDLIKDIIKNNKITKSTLHSLAIAKAQKIVDRIVFACFCEDIGLLPEHTLRKVEKHAEESFSSYWDILKGFFKAIDSGSPKLDIPDGYNGGLFKEDVELDVLIIGDEVCKSIIKLGRYDFEEDLTVNILGHIFEQSINDIEEIKELIDPETFEVKQSKRKKDGIFYTPEYITDYIVKNSLGKYLEEKEQEILKKNKVKDGLKDELFRKREEKAYMEYQTFLQKVKVLDPACGSGAFLVKVFDYLLEENKRVSNILGNIFGMNTYSKSILQNNIYGVDLNEESVEITKLSLWLKTAQKGKKLASLDNNIKCGNSLIDDSSVAGNKAFNWNLEFKEVMDNGGFDVIVGNPPYVVVYDIDIKKYLEESYPEFKRNNDLYIAFIVKGVSLLKDNGYFSFITPNTFLKGSYFKKIRNLLKDYRILEVIDFGNKLVFSDANVFSSIFTLKKDNIDRKFDISLKKDVDNIIGKINYESDRFEIRDNISLYLSSNFSDLEEYFFVKDVGYNYWTKGRGKTRGGSVADRILYKGEKEHYSDIPFIKGSNISPFYISEPKQFLRHNYVEFLSNDDVFRFSEDILSRKPKLVYRQTSSKLISSIDINTYHCDKTVHTVIPKENNIDLYYLLGLFNSKLYDYFYRKLVDEGGKAFAQVKIVYTKQLPFIIGTKEQVESIIKYVKDVESLSTDLYQNINNFSIVISAYLNLKEKKRGIENVYKMDSNEFLSFMKVKSKHIKDVGELLNIFNKHKKYCSELSLKIDYVLDDLNNCIFDLFELSEEYKNIINKFCDKEKK